MGVACLVAAEDGGYTAWMWNTENHVGEGDRKRIFDSRDI